MSECDMDKIREYIKPICADYDSPIRLFYQTVNNIQEQVKGSCDQAVYQAVCKLGIDIEKDKLEQAIHQDRERYEEAYRRGYAKAHEDIIRCKECKYYIEPTEEEAGGCLIKAGYFPVSENWFCADGQMVEDI